MGKGDKKTRRGKIQRGTYGVLRPRGKKKKTADQPKKSAAKKAAPKKAAPKKAAPKKTAAKPAAKKTTKKSTE